MEKSREDTSAALAVEPAVAPDRPALAAATSPAGSQAAQCARDAASRSHRSRATVKRVAIVLSELRAGGMERVVVHLANSLADRGVDPLVVCLQDQGVLAAEVRGRGSAVAALGSNRSYDLAGLSRLAAVLRKFKPDVVNVHDYSSLPYAGVAGLVQPRCPLIFTAHGLLYEGFDGKERRYRFFARRLAALTAVSPEVCRRHREFLNWRGAVHIVPNGVPQVETSPEVRREVRAELALGTDEFVFLAVGNPRPEKAFEDLIAAAARSRELDPERKFAVLVAGTLRDDSYCRSLQRQAAEASVPGLRLLGFRSDVQRLYSAADALVVSSRSEGLPMVVLEAMTAGLPVLSTRVGGIPAAVPEDCGRLVEPADPEDLARGMVGLMQMDRRARLELGCAARRCAERRFGVEAMTSRYLAVFSAPESPLESELS